MGERRSSLAYFEAALDLREQRLEESRKYEKDRIVILRAISDIITDPMVS